MKTGVVAGTIAVGSVFLAAGCGADRGATPELDRPGSIQATSPIPAVKNPRDIVSVARHTCELLTSQQAKGFGLDLPPTASEGLFGTQDCEWLGTTSERETVKQLDLSVFTNNPTLEVAYTKDRRLPFFELTEIAGYPAIVTRTNADLPSCDIDIKTAERQSITVIYDSREFKNNPQQSCEVGKQVAAAVIMNLPPQR